MPLTRIFRCQKALCSKRFRDFGGMLKNLGKPQKNLGSLVQMQQKTRSKPIVSNVFFVKIGGEEGIRSRLRARSGCVLTPHRGVIHFAPVRILSNANAKRTPFGVLRWRRGRDSNPCALSRKLISSQPRYDHFDTSPYIQTSISILLKLRKTEGYLRGMLR